ncbi:MAG TPA: glucose-6-phosphate isomerase [Clostridiales bacterium]|nr:glucose-6-phosphate isomerase [Clostridiales bacterium]
MAVELITRYAEEFLAEGALESISGEAEQAGALVADGEGEGSAFLGWRDLPCGYDRGEFDDILRTARKIIADTDVLIVIGVGGSYLGARAVVEFVHSQHYNALPKKTPDIYFAGNSLSPDALNELLTLCDGKRVSLIVISKSGTTTEPAIAFRIFRKYMLERYTPQEAAGRIYITTDREKGTLRRLAVQEGYKTFVVPEDIGGRYSVLTAVGLLPIAAAGVDICALMQGAVDACAAYREPCFEANPCLRYAALRNLFYRTGKSVEMFVSYEPSFAMMNEWLKQLFGESEGKDGKGLFPASAIYSTDLHSLGQFVQEGSPILFETVVLFDKPKTDIVMGVEEDDGDELNYLAGVEMSQINYKAFQGTVLAHNTGKVPNVVLRLDRKDEYNLGWLIYFFEKACAVSGYILGVNPFDQPGVEQYKKNMFALLGKPGYEASKRELEKKLGL